MDLVKFKIHLEEIGKLVEEKHEFYVPVQVTHELKKKKTRYAKAALKLIENLKMVENKEKDADEAILSLADENTLVATNDKKLRTKLKKFGIKTIYLKGKKYLAIG
jgi:rRNA-processing protein FCF1